MLKNYINTNLFENFMKAHKLSKSKFCKICNIHISTYNKIISNKNFRITALFKIAKVIKIQVCQMFTNKKRP